MIYLIYILTFFLIYISLFFTCEVYYKKIDNNAKYSLILFGVLTSFGFLLKAVHFYDPNNLGYLKTINIEWLFVMPLITLSLVYFSIDISNVPRRFSKSLKIFFTIFCIVILIFTFFQIYSNLDIIFITYHSITEIIFENPYFAILLPLYYLSACLIIAEYANYFYNSNKSKKNIFFKMLPLVSVTFYLVYLFFTNSLYYRFSPHYDYINSVYFSAIPIIVLFLSMKKQSLFNYIDTNILIDSIMFSNEAVIIVKDGVIIATNDAFYNFFFNKKRIDLYGKNFESYLPSDFFSQEIFSDKKLTIRKYENVETLDIIASKTRLDEKSDTYIICMMNVSFLRDLNERAEYIENNIDSLMSDSVKELSELNEQLTAETNKLIDLENEMIIVASSDSLTGLKNRRYFTQACHNILLESDPDLDSHIVVYLDLDNFKNINDTLGHSVGDGVLIEVSRRIEQSVPKNSIISRIGGDEFLIFIKHSKKSHTSADYLVERIGNRLIKNLKKQMSINENFVHTSVSIGFSIYPQAGKDIETLIKTADLAMYSSKDNGKNLYTVFEKRSTNISKNEIELTNDMIMAIEKNEFSLVYQPQIKILGDDIKLIGFEALIRWNHTEKGYISPSDFIPIAEKSGYIKEILIWVINEVCMQIKKWSATYEDFTISVNFSTPKFEKDQIYETLDNIISNLKINPKYMRLEISEKYLVKDIESTIETLESINRLGFQVSIDDFGTNYSSLNYLKSMPIDFIKLDTSFIQGIGINKKDEAIIISLIKLCANSDIGLIAEGVETEEQKDFLLSQGLSTMQGYYFYKPMIASDIEKLNILN